LPSVAHDGDDASAEAERPAAPVLLPQVATPLANLKVLLVDNEEDTRAMVRDALENAGAEVRASSTAHAALAEAAEWRPDLLVTDLGLPGMDGYELLKAIRALRPQHFCPAVAVSAYARLDDRTRARAAGFQAHVAKPVDPASLVVALRTALSSAS
jgi:CheY-like chemotaxis protein